jgi:alpha-tubulin suppressor-like RCC1 family protein
MGDDDLENKSLPVICKVIMRKMRTKIKQVTCGTNHTVVIMCNGSGIAFGDNKFG